MTQSMQRLSHSFLTFSTRSHLITYLLSFLTITLLLTIFSPQPTSGTPHNNNWAVLVSTSRYWFNYRHTSNALAMYHTIKRMGIPDSQIVLMIPDEYACNPRNAYHARMFHDEKKEVNLYAEDIEVDYRGCEVTVANFLRLLTGRHTNEGTPRSQRLLTNKDSNIFIYLSGHGGNNFLKFQDNEEMNSQDLRDAFQQMKVQERYNSILVMLDTCQAATLFWELNPEDSPNVITIGSSKIKENSYSYANDYDVGVSLSDRFTYFTLDFFERNNVITHHNQDHHSKKQIDASGLSSKKTIADLFYSYSPDQLRSQVEFRSDLLLPSFLKVTPSKPDPLAHLPLTDYFGAVTQIQAANGAYPLEAKKEDTKSATVNKSATSSPTSKPPPTTAPAATSSVSNSRSNSFGFSSTSTHDSQQISILLSIGGVILLIFILGDLFRQDGSSQEDESATKKNQ